MSKGNRSPRRNKLSHATAAERSKTKMGEAEKHAAAAVLVKAEPTKNDIAAAVKAKAQMLESNKLAASANDTLKAGAEAQMVQSKNLLFLFTTLNELAAAEKNKAEGALCSCQSSSSDSSTDGGVKERNCRSSQGSS